MDALTHSTSEADAEFGVAGIVGETADTAASTWSGTAAPTFYQRAGKRLLDIVLGTALLIVFLPIMAAATLAVLATSGWPVWHSGERVGRGGRPFRIWKIRTMVRDADEVMARWRENHPYLYAHYERGFKFENDPRATKSGRFLRKASLDELPQLWNVIRGDMSLVGPRPVCGMELRNYGDYAEMFLSVSPGLTGRWQVNGRNRITYPERSWIELAYCRSVTLSGDLAILLRTLAVPLRFDGF